MENKKLTESMNMSSSLRARKYNKDGKEVLDTRIKGSVEKRFSKGAGKAIQIVYKEGNIVHIHCKDSSCNNEWKLKDGTSWASKFEVNGNDIKCLKCGRVHKAG